MQQQNKNNLIDRLNELMFKQIQYVQGRKMNIHSPPHPLIGNNKITK